MPTFTYTARDPKGQIKNATIEAASRDDVVAQLRRQRLNVVKINEETKKQKVGKITMSRIEIDPTFPFFVSSLILTTFIRWRRSCATTSARDAASIVAFLIWPLASRAVYVNVGIWIPLGMY